MPDVICLRPLEDFANVGVVPPRALTIRAMEPESQELAEAMRSAEALVIPAVGPALETELFAGSAIRLVQVTGAGVDRVDGAALAGLGVAVAGIPGRSAPAVAEYVVATAVALMRFLPGTTAAILAGDYMNVRDRMIRCGLNQLAGLTVGVVGYGIIGRATAKQCAALGAEVVFCDPAIDREDGVVLGELLATADIVTLHVPLQDVTRGMIGAAEIGLMKPDAILVNAARGGIVDEAALADALEAGRIGGAAVDVYSSEPPAPDNPLLTVSAAAAQRLILTPHIAGVTRQAWASLFADAWDNVARVLLQGEPPRNVTNGATG
ncbi:MAG: hypothetical protein F4103_05990 [Boseongicola sp. SB0673_bin_14]|nr:hypothetical protein [Boseongicola sp. SB0667_bin_21]MYI68301.1 hypothetical protein [Boseongicola sp. SB0673_bin_14]